MFLSLHESGGIHKEEDGEVSLLDKSNAVELDGNAVRLCHIAPCTDGSLYIVAARHGYSEDEDLILSWTAGQSAAEYVAGPFHDVAGVAVSLAGDLYISEENKHQVGRLDPNSGEYEIVAGGNGRGNRLTQLSEPGNIAIGSDGSVYIADRGNGRIIKWCLRGGTALEIAVVVDGLSHSSLGGVYH